MTSNLDCSRCSMWGSSWILTSASGSTTLALTRHWALRTKWTKCRAVCQAETNGMFAQFRHLKGSLKPFNHAHSLGMIRRIKDAFRFFFLWALFSSLSQIASKCPSKPYCCFATSYALHGSLLGRPCRSPETTKTAWFTWPYCKGFGAGDAKRIA